MHYKTDVFQCNIYAHVSRGDEMLCLIANWHKRYVFIDYMKNYESRKRKHYEEFGADTYKILEIDNTYFPKEIVKKIYILWCMAYENRKQ